jgi:endonuclease/exonuclease/phosphatase family metal-dependent hydrolase
MEPTVVGVVTLLLAGGFWLAWQHNDPPDAAHPSANAGPQQPGTPADPASTPAGIAGQLKNRTGALSKLQQQAQQRSQQLAETPPVSEFVFAQFNTLGASHTAARGKDARMAGGGARGAWVGQLFVSHDVGVGAVQEFQRSQAYAFLNAVGDTYAVWPGVSSTSRDGENSVVWRKDRFEALKTESRAYPYFGGKLRNFPLVLLRDKKTGTKFWVTSYHNPANTRKFGNQVFWKHRALSMEIPDVVSHLRTTKQPLIVSGDMNDRQEFFCPFARGTGMHSASGGWSTAAGCSVPVRWIDWIMGSDKVAFSGYRQDDSAFVDRTSDHPMVLADVTVKGDPRDRLGD